MVISNKTGQMAFHVSSELHSGSSVNVNSLSGVEDMIDIGVITLDQLATERRITGRGVLRIGMSSGEHLVIEGGSRLIRENIDVIAITLHLEHARLDRRTFLDSINLMKTLGFQYFDDAGGRRTPATGLLEQKDVLFVREELF
jgi:hypothetical protein